MVNKLIRMNSVAQKKFHTRDLFPKTATVFNNLQPKYFRHIDFILSQERGLMVEYKAQLGTNGLGI